jgi:hypothetical protein
MTTRIIHACSTRDARPQHIDSDDDYIAVMRELAYQIKCLGAGNSMSEIGAIEGLGMQIVKGLEGVAKSQGQIAESLDACADGLHAIAKAIEEHE